MTGTVPFTGGFRISNFGFRIFRDRPLANQGCVQRDGNSEFRIPNSEFAHRRHCRTERI